METGQCWSTAGQLRPVVGQFRPHARSLLCNGFGDAVSATQQTRPFHNYLETTPVTYLISIYSNNQNTSCMNIENWGIGISKFTRLWLIHTEKNYLDAITDYIWPDGRVYHAISAPLWASQYLWTLLPTRTYTIVSSVQEDFFFNWNSFYNGSLLKWIYCTIRSRPWPLSVEMGCFAWKNLSDDDGDCHVNVWKSY